jgi:DNA (cytosine-5)-methyltransferase 1
MIKILNLYAGIGGNRKLWPDQEIEVTAIEIDPKIARIYSKLYPNDKIIVGDAHEYLLKNFKNFDFIWSSPPCPTHSRMNNTLHHQGIIRYPDMKLWQEIIFLQSWFKGKWVVENVISYYKPLIKPFESDRHYFWSDSYITKKKNRTDGDYLNAFGSNRFTTDEHIKFLEKHHNINLEEFDISKTLKVKMLSNCVKPSTGLHIFKCAFKEKQSTLSF